MQSAKTVSADIVSELQALLSKKLSIRIESPEADLLDSGTFDSLALVQVIAHLEEHFQVSLLTDELEPDSFRSVKKIAEMIVRRQLAESGAVPAAGEPNPKPVVLASTQVSNGLLSDVEELLIAKLNIKVESPDQELIQSGILDSMMLVQLVMGIQERFGLEMPVEGLDFAVFNSVRNIANFISRRTAASKVGAGQ